MRRDFAIPCGNPECVAYLSAMSSIVSTSTGLKAAWNIPPEAVFRATALMLLRLSMYNFLSLCGQNDACL